MAFSCIHLQFLFCFLKIPMAFFSASNKAELENSLNKKPLIPSWMVSLSPPVARAIGRHPYRIAIIWVSPHGSKREGMRIISAPLYNWLANWESNFKIVLTRSGNYSLNFWQLFSISRFPEPKMIN